MAYKFNDDYRYKIALGQVNGTKTVNKFGFNPDVDTATDPEVIAYFGGTGFAIMTSGDTLDVVSASANDVNTTGSGAQQILIEGIDTSHNFQSEIVNMNGLTPVTTSNSWLGVNRAYVITSGSSDYNEGNIAITDTAGTVGTQGMIPINESVTQQLLYHTPIDKTFLMDWWWFHVTKLSGGSAPKVTVVGTSYSRVTDTLYEVFRTTIDTAVENTEQFMPSQPLIIGGREVLYFTAETDTNNTEVVGRFSGIEVDS